MPCIYVCPCLSRVPPLSLFVLNSKVLCISFCWLFRSGIAWLSSMTGLTCLFLSNRYDIRNIIDGNNWQLGMIYLYLKKIFLLALFLESQSTCITWHWDFNLKFSGLPRWPGYCLCKGGYYTSFLLKWLFKCNSNQTVKFSRIRHIMGLKGWFSSLKTCDDVKMYTIRSSLVLVAQIVKNLPTMKETEVRSLEGPL